MGFGEIGKIVSRVARGFGMEVLVADPYTKPEVAAEHRARLVELDELLSRSGVVSLHAPLTPTTCHLINEERLGRMRHDAAREHGQIRTGRRSGAGPGPDRWRRARVAEAEQDATGAVSFGGRALAEVPNLLLTPHIAGQTEQALLNVGSTAWSDIQAVLAGHLPLHPVAAAKR